MEAHAPEGCLCPFHRCVTHLDRLFAIAAGGGRRTACHNPKLQNDPIKPRLWITPFGLRDLAGSDAQRNRTIDTTINLRIRF